MFNFGKVKKKTENKKNEPVDLQMYNRIKAKVKSTVQRWPSAYASGQLVRQYKVAFAKKYGSRKSPYTNTRRSNRYGNIRGSIKRFSERYYKGVLNTKIKKRKTLMNKLKRLEDENTALLNELQNDLDIFLKNKYTPISNKIIRMSKKFEPRTYARAQKKYKETGKYKYVIGGKPSMVLRKITPFTFKNEKEYYRLLSDIKPLNKEYRNKKSILEYNKRNYNRLRRNLNRSINIVNKDISKIVARTSTYGPRKSPYKQIRGSSYGSFLDDMKKKLPTIAVATTAFNVLDEVSSRAIKKIKRKSLKYRKNITPATFKKIMTQTSTEPLKKAIARRTKGTVKGVAWFTPIVTYMERRGVPRSSSKFGKKKKKPRGTLRRWFDEKWVDVCSPLPGGGFKPCGRKTATGKRKYPYCRPLKRKGKGTPKTAREILKEVGGRKKLQELCKKKRVAKTKTLPHRWN
jgi:hypothetical protein